MTMLLALMLMAAAAYAEPVKHGETMCEGPACRQVEGEGVPSLARPLPSPAPQVTSVRARTQHPTSKEQAKTIRAPSGEAPTNLPAYYAEAAGRGEPPRATTDVVLVPKSHDPKLDGLRTGDLLHAILEQEIVASPETPTPIRARVTRGTYSGAWLVGEATLDKELKRVLLSFTKMRVPGSETVYGLKGTGLSPLGSVGLTGEYESQTGLFFFAELGSAGAAGFVDSTINRNATALGTYTQEPSLENAGKAAAVTALSKTTERMAGSVRERPGYTHVPGFQEIQVLVTEDPSESIN